jgi:hypothetical protein
LVLALRARVMKTTIDLPEVLVKQAKQKALHQGRAFKDLIADYIRQGLNEQPSHAAVSRSSGALEIDPDGLPLFRGQASQGFRQPALADTLALEHSTLEQEDLQRVGLAH